MDRHRGRNLSKATILFYRNDDQRVAVKSFADKPLVVRQLLGRWMIRREAMAYEAAGDAPGLAPFLGRLGPFALATEWVEARPLAERGGAPEGVIERVEEIVAGLHQRGLALGDLHHRDILVADDGRVWLIDLAAAVWLGPRSGGLRRRWFRRWQEQDQVSLVKIRARLGGEDPAAAVARMGSRAARRYRRRRAIRLLWDRARGKELEPVEYRGVGDDHE